MCLQFVIELLLNLSVFNVMNIQTHFIKHAGNLKARAREMR